MALNNPIKNPASTAPPVVFGTANETLQSLTSLAVNTINGQLDSFILRLVDAFMKHSELSIVAKEAAATFKAAGLLKNNTYTFYYLASSHIENEIKTQIEKATNPSAFNRVVEEDELSLVSYEEVDQRLLLANISRPIEHKNTERLHALTMRVAHLLKRDDIPLSQNPFRPEVYLTAIYSAWIEFDPDTDSHALLLPLMEPEIFINLGPVFDALNDTLIARGVLPGLGENYRIRKSNTAQETAKQKADAEERDQHLRRLLMPGAAGGSAANPGQLGAGSSNIGQAGGGVGEFGNFQQQVLQASAVSNQLLGYLANLQKNIFDQPLTATASSNPGSNVTIFSSIKQQAPQGTLTQVDENAMDLLTQVFDVVFNDRHIPNEIKTLIGLLQVPVLKAALLDKEFFFKEEHPARRLIELLTKSSVAWDQKKGKEDPLYQTIHSNVKRVQQEYDQKVTVFTDVVASIESFIEEEEKESAASLSAPITEALHKEQTVQATKAAKNEVAMRVGSGEVVAFVETFLENKWVSVLTLAYGVREEKPQVLESAIRTMDDLVWSVKPKISLQERKDLIAKLPSMLSALNKWLNLVKLDDAERLQFFAELAECHASIVRAPLELSPQRQLEIAMEVARKAAERRREKQTNKVPEPTPDEFEDQVENIERGTWFEFTQKDDTLKKVRLAWISPLRSLYIFSTQDKQESFSMSAEELATCIREQRATVVLLAGVMERALSNAFETVGANDPEMETKSVA